VVVSTPVQEVGIITTLPLKMEEDFLGLRVLVLPHEAHRSVFSDRGRSVTVEGDLSINLLTSLIFFLLTNHLPVLVDFVSSEASASPQVMLFKTVVLLAVFSHLLSQSNYYSQRLGGRP